jgi:16S rRNA (uracil1498-N3)-methyltransferase
MQFTYHKSSGEQTLKIEGDLHKYLFKIRRESSSSNLYFRNLVDKNIYEYEVLNTNRKDSNLKLISCEEKTIEPSVDLHIGWCVIDPKNIEKVIASLNEIGLTKITFIRCDFSQKKYTINFEKLNRLLQNSSSQSGRSNIILLDECKSMAEFIHMHPEAYMFNFTSNHISKVKNNIKTIIVGCEGGFSSKEIENFNADNIVGCNTNTILKSETAVMTVSSLILS